MPSKKSMKSRKNIHRRKTTKVHRRRKNQRGGNQEPAQDASQPVVLPVDNVPAEFKPQQMEPAAEPEIAGEVNKEIADLIPDALPQAEAEPTTQPPISESVEVVVEEPEPVNEPTPEPVEVVEAEAPAEPVEEEEPKEEPEREFAATGPEGKGYKGAEEDSIFKRLSVGFLTTFGSGTEAKRVLAKYREPASLRKYKLDDKAEFSGGLFGKVTRTALRKRPSYRDEKTGKVRNEMPAGSKVMDIFSIADNFAKDSIKKNDDFFHLWAGDNQNLKWKTEAKGGRIYLKAVATRDIQDNELLVIETTNWPDIFIPKPSIDDVYHGETTPAVAE